MLMAEITTIARPYAKAAFELARDQTKLAEWSKVLQFFGEVAADRSVVVLLKHPDATPALLANFFIQISKKYIFPEGERFLRYLSDKRRLNALPEISRLFDRYRQQFERVANVEIVTAEPLSNEYQQQFIEALKKRLGRTVVLRSVLDPSLIGGAIVRIGDMVIDGSVRGRLAKLADALVA